MNKKEKKEVEVAVAVEVVEVAVEVVEVAVEVKVVEVAEVKQMQQ
jgi:hypothetical protein